MTADATTYRLLRGDGMRIRHFGEELTVTPGREAHRPAPLAADAEAVAS